MDRELVGTLTELGLSATEAEIYIAMVQQGASGPVSAYKLAQDMGRDPANMTKTLAAMARRGAVRTSGQKPRQYAPVAPEDFTGELIARLRARQQLAVARLRELGQAAPDESLRPLTGRREALETARSLLLQARRVVLADAAAPLLDHLADAFATAARQGATVLVRSDAPREIPRARVWLDRGADAMLGAAPGPWLRLAIDGDGYLEAVAHPAGGDALLHGHWSRAATRAFLAHRALAAELMLTDTHELLAGGASADVARTRAAERAELLLRLVGWRERWDAAGLPAYESPTEAEIDPAVVSETMKELEAEAGAAAEDSGGPLQFIFRRKRKSERG